MSAHAKEPLPPDFRYLSIIQTIREIAANELVYEVDVTGWSKRKMDNAAMHESKILLGITVFTDPKSTKAEQEAIEEETFESIMFLKSVGILKPAINREAILDGMTKMNATYEAMRGIMREILIVLQDVRETVERIDNRK